MLKLFLPAVKQVKTKEIPLSASRTVPEVDDKSKDKTKFILVSAFPKSGSTYLTRLLSEITGYPRGHFVQFYEHNEQDLCEFRLINSIGKKYVIHQHVKGTDNNILLMKKYNIKPVVLVRNVFDILFSLRDHIINEDHRSPICYVHKEYFTMEEHDKLTYLSKICIPWYLNYFVSWLEAENEIEVYWLTYEDLFSLKKSELISEILDFNGLSADREIINNSIKVMKNRDTRLNVGMSGRGQQLPQKERELILDLARAWRLPSGAFERIGLQL